MKAGIDAKVLTTGALQRIDSRLRDVKRTPVECVVLNAVHCELLRRGEYEVAARLIQKEG